MLVLWWIDIDPLWLTTQQSGTFDARFPVTRTSQLIGATTQDVGALQRIDQSVMAIRKSSSGIKYSNSVSVKRCFFSMHEFRVNGFVSTPEFVFQSDDVLGVTIGDTVSVILSFMIGSLSSFLVVGFVGVCTGIGSQLALKVFKLKVFRPWKLVRREMKFTQELWIW